MCHCKAWPHEHEPMSPKLARAAIASVTKARPGMDGISYLMGLIELGVETALTFSYRKEILDLTNTSTLPDAMAKARGRVLRN
jgi:hypothetical protein